MTGKEIRQKFLDFFIQKDHKLVSSSPVIPADDPTLIFANAGMNQFKEYLSGDVKPPFPRVVSVQKCIRVSGKHNDFEDVGYDGTHHTFFEMLGNWSFGDYYKKEAISMAWELLGNFGLDPERMYATVYKDDSEAEKLWKELSSLPSERIMRFGKKDNFWEMGDTGPCGPCSEIHYDRGKGHCFREDQKGHICGVNVEGCCRFVEIWNLVFIQFNRDENGEIHPLKIKSVDTGLGLERLVSILNQTSSNYQTDLFLPLFNKIHQNTGIEPEKDLVAFQIIADHVRALCVSLADGGMPGNEGRGYVIRKILRRAVRFGRRLGMKHAWLYTLAQAAGDILGDVYPEIPQNMNRIMMIMKNEEDRFLETLDVGLGLLSTSIDDLPDGTTALPGEIIFRLYDTYGFPVDITREIVREKGLTLDEQGYEKLMEEQKERGRMSRQGSSGSVESMDVDDLKDTEFTGYDRLTDEQSLSVLFTAQGRIEEAGPGLQVTLIYPSSPFYAESGGQIGDRGRIECGPAVVEITGTRKKNGVFLHEGIVRENTLKSGAVCRLSVDPFIRVDVMRNHSATHLLQAALRNVLGEHVGQSGSYVGPDRLRFDFTHFNALSPEELQKVEDHVNEYIRSASPVETTVMEKEEAVRQGAIAFFGEKYGETVRVVTMGKISRELCGGTHVSNTGQIGLFTILNESSIAAGVRRIEASTGRGAFEILRHYRTELSMISSLLKTGRNLPERIRKILEQNKELEKKIRSGAGGTGVPDVSEFMSAKKIFSNVAVLPALVHDLPVEAQRKLNDQLKAKLGSGIVFIINALKKRVVVTVSVSRDLTDRYQAGVLVKRFSAVLGGKGGGKPEFAQGGGEFSPDLKQKLDRFLEQEL